VWPGFLNNKNATGDGSPSVAFKFITGNFPLSEKGIYVLCVFQRHTGVLLVGLYYQAVPQGRHGNCIMLDNGIK
jgi:hypothetical protein